MITEAEDKERMQIAFTRKTTVEDLLQSVTDLANKNWWAGYAEGETKGYFKGYEEGRQDEREKSKLEDTIQS